MTHPLTGEQVENLEALRVQSVGSHSLGAQQAYINGLEFHLAAQHARVQELESQLTPYVRQLESQRAEQAAMNDRLAAQLAPYSQAGPLTERLEVVLKQLAQVTLERDNVNHKIQATAEYNGQLRQQLAKMTQERDRLAKTLNTPEVIDFTGAVIVEAAHQRERWGMAHDAEKTDADWFWLVGYLAGKALHIPETRLHHCIAAAAALANWHLYSANVKIERSVDTTTEQLLIEAQARITELEGDFLLVSEQMKALKQQLATEQHQHHALNMALMSPPEESALERVTRPLREQLAASEQREKSQDVQMNAVRCRAEQSEQRVKELEEDRIPDQQTYMFWTTKCDGLQLQLHHFTKQNDKLQARVTTLEEACAESLALVEPLAPNHALVQRLSEMLATAQGTSATTKSERG